LIQPPFLSTIVTATSRRPSTPSSGQRVWRSFELRCGPRTRDAHSERWVRIVRREVLELDRTLIFGRLESLLVEFIDHYNRARPHQGDRTAAAL